MQPMAAAELPSIRILPAVLFMRATPKRSYLWKLLLRVFHAGADGVPVECQRLGLAAELLVQRFFHLGQIDVEQLRHNADVNHVADQAAQPRVGQTGSDQLVERNRIKRQVLAQSIQLQRLVVNHAGVRSQTHHIFARRFRIHRHQKVDLLLPRDVAVVVGADGEPRGQPGDVGREKVLAGNRNAHLENRAHQDGIGGLAAGTVDRRHLNAHVVENSLGLCLRSAAEPRVSIVAITLLGSWVHCAEARSGPSSSC